MIRRLWVPSRNSQWLVQIGSKWRDSRRRKGSIRGRVGNCIFYPWGRAQLQIDFEGRPWRSPSLRCKFPSCFRTLYWSSCWSEVASLRRCCWWRSGRRVGRVRVSGGWDSSLSWLNRKLIVLWEVRLWGEVRRRSRRNLWLCPFLWSKFSPKNLQ